MCKHAIKSLPMLITEVLCSFRLRSRTVLGFTFLLNSFVLLGAVGQAQTFNQIGFVIGTGSDDLRGDSSATAALVASNGTTLQTITLKSQNASAWNNNSTNTVTASLSPALTQAQISHIVITLTSHNGFAESNDQWNVQSVSVSLSNNGVGSILLVNGSGNPFHQLNASTPSFTLTPQPVAPPGSFNQIQFVIGTGNDDLRGDSSATATLKAANGSTLQVITLKSQNASSWNNNTTNTVTAPLSPALAPAQIARVIITLTSHNSITESNDQWLIQSVNISLSNNGSGAQSLMSFSGAPLAQLNASQPSLTLPLTSVGPPGSFNEIQFVIGTGNDDLRGDSSAIAALQAANGSTLQTITLKQQSAASWNQNTSQTVTAPLSPSLVPTQIAHIVITLTSHNSAFETDDNWDVQNVTISLTNNGTAPHPLMNFSGAPLARLTGVQPNLILPPEMATRGLGMTMPVTPPVENLNLAVNPALPTGVLPFGYQVAPPGFLDPSSSSMLSGSCSPSAMACLPAIDVAGHVQEHDQRLNPFMRMNAASHDAKLLLARAVWISLGLPPAGSISGSSCGGTNAECATALAQLAVTGRQAFKSFVGWSPGFAPASSGPQVDDLVQLAQSGYHDVPAMPASITATQLQSACTNVLNQAYTALWAIRSNVAAWRQFRLNGVWIAASGEDDTPHRPVNVPSAPFPQFDIPVPVTVGGQPFTLMTRYMIATANSLMNLTAPAAAAAPAIPVILQRCLPGHVCPPRLAIPSDTPSTLPDAPLNTRNVIIYIHGGGSRLEEAVPMATQFVSQFGRWSNDLVVISFDLPASAYDDLFFTSAPGAAGGRIPVDASSSAFENGPNGGVPKNIGNLPVLNFTLNFINNFITTLGQQGIIDPHRVLAVMGGSLGGNTSLALGMNPMPAPFHLERPLAFSAPASAPGGAQPTIVSWSVTTMVSDEGNAALIVVGNMCCLPAGIGNGGTTWGPESGSTRSDYISHLYFSGTAPGLPADPEMWYRNDWSTTHGTNAGQALIAQSRFDRYEIYSPQARLWTTAIDTEQSIASFQHNTDTSGHSYQAGYQLVRARLLLASGACDDYDNGNSTSPVMSPPSVSIGSCNNHAIGNTGTNALNHQDIYGFTHDLANDMRNATGTTLFLNDTGHSIHDERPAFFTRQIFSFLNMPDNNVNITLVTGDDDLRWNSEVHAVIGSTALPAPLDLPLNLWFHPWPSSNGSPNNPCGACYKLTSFHFPSSNTVNNFTISLPSGLNPGAINSFQLKFIAGTSSIGNTTDGWKLAAVAACIPGKAGAFINDGFPGNSTVHNFNPTSNNQPMLWQPPSFQSPAISSLQNNCSAISTNPPPNGDVPSGVWNNGIKF